MGPQDPKDVTRDTARDLSALVGELAALKGDATHWLTDPEYAALRHRLGVVKVACTKGQSLYLRVSLEADIVDHSRSRAKLRGRKANGCT